VVSARFKDTLFISCKCTLLLHGLERRGYPVCLGKRKGFEMVVDGFRTESNLQGDGISEKTLTIIVPYVPIRP
jgi:hypothetical protein